MLRERERRNPGFRWVPGCMVLRVFPVLCSPGTQAARLPSTAVCVLPSALLPPHRHAGVISEQIPERQRYQIRKDQLTGYGISGSRQNLLEGFYHFNNTRTKQLARATHLSLPFVSSESSRCWVPSFAPVWASFPQVPPGGRCLQPSPLPAPLRPSTSWWGRTGRRHAAMGGLPSTRPVEYERQ